ncbi:MAG TPA: helix-turn-helix domain-containing protein [Chloroflexota bacterium]|jgi:transposase
MPLALTATERAALERAAAGERRARAWRRYRAVLLAAERGPEQAAAVLGCAHSSVYAWLAAWRRDGLAGLAERRRRGGRPARLAGEGTALLARLLGEDPQARGWHATGWTVPLLRTELARAGYPAGDRTVRRALHRLGWAWTRPTYLLGRPDPAYAEKKPRWSSAPARS